jgi:cardiolipin synthase
LALMAGIKIYTYYPVMMHAKAAIVDDNWATAGSYNLDNLSAIFNHEANIGSNDAYFVDQIKRHFFDDLEHSRRVHYEVWIKRPLFKKFLELLTWPFHDLM